MKFIFTGTPTKREILLYLKNKKYSLINKTKLKIDIVRYRQKNSNIKIDIQKRKMYTIRKKVVKDLNNFLEYKNECFKTLSKILFYKNLDRKFLTMLFYCKYDIENLFSYIYFNILYFTRILKLMNKKAKNEFFIEETGSNVKSIDFTVIFSPIKLDKSNMFDDELKWTKPFNNKRKNNLKIISDMSKRKDVNTNNNFCNVIDNDKDVNTNNNFCNVIDNDKDVNTNNNFCNVIDNNKDVNTNNNFCNNMNNIKLDYNIDNKLNNQIDHFTNNKVNNKIDFFVNKNKKVDFNYKKVPKNQFKKNKQNYNKFVLSEIDSNIIKKDKFKDYNKELIRNTKMNAGYKNIIIKYTDKLITNHIKTEKTRKSRIKFVDNEDYIDVHNSQNIIPIIKKTKLQKNTNKNKHKEIVFIQNVDFNKREDF